MKLNHEKYGKLGREKVAIGGFKNSLYKLNQVLEKGGHSSGWAAFGRNKGLNPSMPLVKTCNMPSLFAYFNAKNVYQRQF